MRGKFGAFCVGALIAMTLVVAGFPLVRMLPRADAAWLLFLGIAYLWVRDAAPGSKLAGTAGAGFAAVVFFWLPNTVFYHVLFVGAAYGLFRISTKKEIIDVTC